MAEHDRDLLSKSCTKLAAFANKGSILFDGLLEGYLNRKKK
jgi:hypothetical protein